MYVVYCSNTILGHAEDNYPTQGVMKDYAAALGLTYKQVRGWFFGRRRREKNENDVRVLSSKKHVSAKNGIAVVAAKKILRRVGLAAHSRRNMSSSSNYKRAHLGAHRWHCFHNNDSGAVERERLLNEDLLTADYLLKKVFRKDGPPLGVEFDSLPSRSFCHCTGMLWHLPSFCLLSDLYYVVSARGLLHQKWWIFAANLLGNYLLNHALSMEEMWCCYSSAKSLLSSKKWINTCSSFLDFLIS